MVDRERALAKLDQLQGYLAELRSVVPDDFASYRDPRTKRACERLLQVAIECVLDLCGILTAGLRLGLPADEDDLLTRLQEGGVLTAETLAPLRTMKGLRNLLVHGYGGIDDTIVFEILGMRLPDLDAFADEVRASLPDAHI